MSWLKKDVDQKTALFTVDWKDLSNFETPARKAEVTRLNHYQQIASSNWYGTKEKPVLVIPGAPKRYEPLPNLSSYVVQLAQDSGTRMVDGNHYMSPEYPLESLFRAVKVCTQMEKGTAQAFDFQLFDFVTDRNNLRKLMIYCKNESNEPFRIDMERVGNTVAFMRCQPKDVEGVATRSVVYGKDLENRCAKTVHAEVCGSTGQPLTGGSFHQVASYELGGLTFLVRFEVDCVDYKQSRPLKQGDADQLADAMSAVRLAKVAGPEPINFPESKLSYIQFGTRHQYHLMELTTLCERYDFPKDKWSQLFFSNTETLVVVKHTFGRCQGAQVYTAEQARQKQKFDTEKTVRLVVELLYRLLAFMRSRPEGERLALIFEAGSKITVYKKLDSTKHILPNQFLKEVRGEKLQ